MTSLNTKTTGYNILWGTSNDRQELKGETVPRGIGNNNYVGFKYNEGDGALHWFQ